MWSETTIAPDVLTILILRIIVLINMDDLPGTPIEDEFLQGSG